MALDQQYKDKVSETIANQVEILQEEVVRDLLKLSKDIRFKTVDEFLFAMEQLDIEEMVILKAKNILNGYNVAHKEILTGMVLFGEMTEDTLITLANFSQSSFAESIGKMAGVLKTEIIKGVLGEATDKGILQAIQAQAGLSNSQMQTLVTTGLNDFSASVGKLMMDKSPDNEKFRYTGPIDSKTRDFCIRAWEVGTITKKEIYQRFPDNGQGGDPVIRRGGYNCRHQWFPVKASDKSKDVREDASK